ncbi:hypothetical protein M9H77_17742 [Catharanthus roseus]|uniref:Uncharacterized protein n=1 Tax=Catharanthus roseus TaxID=4058 RepID=A0ACC0B5H1_CATRO|nr:hypothetical protein M9H77_17742 [Catharanthus roseus]
MEGENGQVLVKSTLPLTVALPLQLLAGFWSRFGCKSIPYYVRLTMSTDGYLSAQSHQEYTSDPIRMNLHDTLRSMQQSIERLARQFQSVAKDVEELKWGKSSATMEQRVGYQGRPQVRCGRRGGLGERGYYRPQVEFARHEAWHEDNLYKDYGDNPNVGQAYHGGYYGNQQGNKALDRIK